MHKKLELDRYVVWSLLTYLVFFRVEERPISFIHTGSRTTLECRRWTWWAWFQISYSENAGLPCRKTTVSAKDGSSSSWFNRMGHGYDSTWIPFFIPVYFITRREQWIKMDLGNVPGYGWIASALTKGRGLQILWVCQSHRARCEGRASSTLKKWLKQRKRWYWSDGVWQRAGTCNCTFANDHESHAGTTE